MRVLVTGSSGFIGKRLVEELRKKNYSVKEFDLDKGLDLLRERDCLEATRGVEAVIHLAVALDEHSPLLWNVNVHGTENIIKASAENKAERFIHISTVGVYGDQKGRVDERTEFNPITDYEKSKAEAERVVQSYQEMIHITIIRPTIVLGLNEHWKKIIRLMERDYPLIGNGKNKWQVVYIDDLVRAIVFCLEHEKTKGEDFIIAEEEALTLEELLIELRKALGLKPRMRKIPYCLGKALAYLYITFFRKTILSPQHLHRLKRNRDYSIEKIKRFGWKPRYSAREGISETVKEFKE